MFVGCGWLCNVPSAQSAFAGAEGGLSKSESGVAGRCEGVIPERGIWGLSKARYSSVRSNSLNDLFVTDV